MSRRFARAKVGLVVIEYCVGGQVEGRSLEKRLRYDASSIRQSGPLVGAHAKP